MKGRTKSRELRGERRGPGLRYQCVDGGSDIINFIICIIQQILLKWITESELDRVCSTHGEMRNVHIILVEKCRT
jgi:hypothetical protein